LVRVTDIHPAEFLVIGWMKNAIGTFSKWCSELDIKSSLFTSLS